MQESHLRTRRQQEQIEKKCCPAVMIIIWLFDSVPFGKLQQHPSRRVWCVRVSDGRFDPVAALLPMSLAGAWSSMYGSPSTGQAYIPFFSSGQRCHLSIEECKIHGQDGKRKERAQACPSISSIVISLAATGTLGDCRLTPKLYGDAPSPAVRCESILVPDRPAIVPSPEV